MWSIYFCLLATLGSNYGNPRRLGLSEGDGCRLANGGRGTCQKFSECPPAVEELDETGQWPSDTFCDFQEFDPIICCDSSETTTTSSTTSTTTTTATPTTTTTKRPLSKKPGKIAKIKCKKYSKWSESPVLIMDAAKKFQAGICGISVEKLITGGKNASEMEFPHMVHLGYGIGAKRYACGASLISDKYLLTAAHCLKTEYPTIAELGWGDSRFSTMRKVAEVIPHPDYNPFEYYNDIALLRMEYPLEEFTDYMRPACLQVDRVVHEEQALACGWGLTNSSDEDGSDYLLKVNLTILDSHDCDKNYPKEERFLKRGLDPITMICAGDPEHQKDTCDGDSGGPLQTIKKKPHCMYSIIGVTSFGKKMGCGTAPAIYTRVSEYVGWIESIVWPDEVEKFNSNTKLRKRNRWNH